MSDSPNRPIRSRNHQCPEKDIYHTLQNSGILEETGCTRNVCLGSVVGQPGRDKPRNSEDVLKQAKDFQNQYYASLKRVENSEKHNRWQVIQKEISETGTYTLTEPELVFGAKCAWRNSVRCIGRIQWSKLKVFDCRHVTTTKQMFEALLNHIDYSTNKGNIRSAITVFKQRTDKNRDFRVWNSQLVSFAGYRRPDGTVVGDPMNVEFTELCQKLGWKGAGGRWDILPLVLSADGNDPDIYEIPKENVLQVPLTHPTYDWFQSLGLRWYALPAVANMLFDCGGLQFTAAPFNGWYMSTEIGCRNLCDTNRLNMLEPVAKKMGLDTRTPVSLWKDKAMVECNLAVLHSFQQKGVTIVDHHTASESFMKHLENESRLRNGCPADWVWIVPPLSGSATPVFHQEMALYFLKPSYEYQTPAWKAHTWRNKQIKDDQKDLIRKYKFKHAALALAFSTKLYMQALSRRVKLIVLYATETGKSENFAKKIGEIFSHAFNVSLYCMEDYDFENLQKESFLLVVTSTFGNGESPENGEEFSRNLHNLATNEYRVRLNSLRYGVFALGSSAYPNFCAFGKHVDKTLSDLGAKRLLKVATADEMTGQEQSFKSWAPQIFKVACESFGITVSKYMQDALSTLQKASTVPQCVRFTKTKPDDIVSALTKRHHKKVTTCRLKRRYVVTDENQTATTVLVELKNCEDYNPGDHIGVFPTNREELVNKVLGRLKGVVDPDQAVQVEYLEKESAGEDWQQCDRLPSASIRELFTRYLDITTPPPTSLLQYFASIAEDEEERKNLTNLATDEIEYKQWRRHRFPNLAETLEEFPSVHPQAATLVTLLNLMQPRFYSISSSPLLHPGEIHLTVAVVTYRTKDGKGPMHFGVCSNYLQDVPVGTMVHYFVRSAPSFHLPTTTSLPVIMVGPGTGIAPFRSFWQHRQAQLEAAEEVDEVKPQEDTHGDSQPDAHGKMWLFFGCRSREFDLYREEKQNMVNGKVLDRVFLAMSREPLIPKTYVQDFILQQGADIHKVLTEEQGHLYVCGDCSMAESVHQTLKHIFKMYGRMSEKEVQSYLLSLKEENRYHEDIFGVNFRSSEDQSESSIRPSSSSIEL